MTHYLEIRSTQLVDKIGESSLSFASALGIQATYEMLLTIGRHALWWPSS